MATHATAYYEGLVLDFEFNAGAWAMPSTLYIGLQTVGDVEPTIGANYARVAVASGASGFGAPSPATNGREIANLALLQFPQNNSGSSHGTMTQIVVHDAATGGNELFKGPLDTNIPYDDGVQPEIAIGALIIRRVRTDPGGGFHGQTDSRIDQELNHLRGNAAWSAPTYTHRLLTAITDLAAGTVTEVSGGGYAPKATSWANADAEGTTVAQGRAVLNDAEINHGTNGQSSQSLVGWSLHDGTDERWIIRESATWPDGGTIRWPASALNVYIS